MGNRRRLAKSEDTQYRPPTIYCWMRIMKTRISPLSLLASLLLTAAISQSLSSAQPARPGRGFGLQGPQVVSPEVAGDCRITFRILAPKAEMVKLSGSDIPGVGQAAEMTKGT